MKTGTHHWHIRGRAWMIIVAAVLTLGFGAGNAQAVVTSSFWVPLNGSVFDGSTNEDVLLMGNLHTVTQVWMGADGLMLAAHVNLPAIMGMGETSGMTYMANGAGQLPPNPYSPDTPFYFAVSLRLKPPSPNINNIVPLIIWQRLMIGENGQVMGADARFGRSFTCNPFTRNCD